MKWGFLFGLFFLGVPVGLGVLVTFAKVQTVVCQTQYGPCDQTTTDLFATLRDQSLFMPPPVALPTELISYSTHSRLPGTLQVTVVIRQPLGVVIGSDQAAFLVDRAGQAYQPLTTASSLPRLLWDQPTQLGQALPKIGVSALSFLTTLPGSAIKHGYLTANLFVFYTNSTFVLVDVDQDFLTAQSSLQAVLTRSKINSQIPKKIDLRYQNPIVVY